LVTRFGVRSRQKLPLYLAVIICFPGVVTVRRLIAAFYIWTAVAASGAGHSLLCRNNFCGGLLANIQPDHPTSCGIGERIHLARHARAIMGAYHRRLFDGLVNFPKYTICQNRPLSVLAIALKFHFPQSRGTTVIKFWEIPCFLEARYPHRSKTTPCTSGQSRSDFQEDFARLGEAFIFKMVLVEEFWIFGFWIGGRTSAKARILAIFF